MSTYAVDLGTESDRVNWITNPSFENSNRTGWTDLRMSSWSYPTTGPYAGNRAADGKCDDSGADIWFGTNYTPIPFGTDVRAFIYVKNTAGNTSRTARIDIEFVDFFGARIEPLVGTATATSGSWTRLEVKGEIPNGATDARIRVYPQLTNGSATNYTSFDGACLEFYSGDEPTTFYFDAGNTSFLPAGAEDLYTSWGPGTPGTSATSYLYAVTWTELDDVVTVQANIGKSSDTEPTSPSSAAVTAWYPNGWASPNPLLTTNRRIQIRRVGRAVPLWQGRVTDVRAEWGQPYVGSTGNGDFVTITAEGALGELGRRTYEFFAQTTTISDLLQDAGSPILIPRWEATIGEDPIVKTPDGTASLAEYVNTAALTYNADVIDGLWDWYVSSQYLNRTAAVSFSDTGQSTLVRSFESAVYDSLAENRITRVDISTATSTYQIDSYIRPASDIAITTFSQDFSTAQGLGLDLIAKYGEPALDIADVSCLEQAQTTMNLDSLEASSSTDSWAEIIGKMVQVTLRGITQKRKVIGASFTATPGDARYSYYFAAYRAVPYLVLDDADRGVLDQNRLAY